MKTFKNLGDIEKRLAHNPKLLTVGEQFNILEECFGSGVMKVVSTEQVRSPLRTGGYTLYTCYNYRYADDERNGKMLATAWVRKA